MLMITEEQNGDMTLFTLAGALAGDWAIEFRRCWSAASSSSKRRRIVVDAAEVTFIYDLGREVLSQIINEGAEIIARDVLMKSIVEEITTKLPSRELNTGAIQMCKRHIKSFLAGLFVALMFAAEGRAQSAQGAPCETTMRKAPASALIDRELLSRAEERADALRAKLFDLQLNEMDLMARLDELDYRTSPEGLQRALAFVGSPRPMDELREGLRIRLEGERARVNKQLDLLGASRERLEAAIRDAESEIERLRQR